MLEGEGDADDGVCGLCASEADGESSSGTQGEDDKKGGNKEDNMSDGEVDGEGDRVAVGASAGAVCASLLSPCRGFVKANGSNTPACTEP
jgi:hypothetical protein